MLIDARTEPTALADSPHLHSAERGDCWIGWRGSPYLPGQAAGRASIEKLLEAGGIEAISRRAVELRGIYGLFIHDRQARRWRVSADTTGLYRIFYSKTMASTSFLELARAERLTAEDANLKYVIEFIAHGGNFGAQTPINGIHKLRYDQHLTIDGNQQPLVAVDSRRTRDDEVFDDDYVERFFEHLVQAIDGLKTSVDLTGGYDSRVINCFLSRGGLDFECALSGVVGSNENRTAARVAAMLERPFIFQEHDISRLEHDLPAGFIDGDGLSEIPRLHRDRQFCLSRLARGVALMVHGGGGEFFRDNYFIQDFPRYGSRHSNIERFYRLRTVPVPLPADQLSKAGASCLQELVAETIARFADCREATNNRTYERIFREYRAAELWGPALTNYTNLGMRVMAPFLDEGMIGYGTRLPPWQRFFAQWPRHVLSAHCPRLADLPTTEGYTASDRRSRFMLELGTYARVQSGRIARKMSERYLGKALFHQVGELEADAPGYRDALRRSALLAAALKKLAEAGIVHDGLTIATIRNVHLGRIITMGTLLRYLDGEPIGAER